jgi:hypothetical protein
MYGREFETALSAVAPERRRSVKKKLKRRDYVAWWQARLLRPSARSSASAALGRPATLPGPDGRFLGAITGELRAQFEMRGVFQAVAPSETMLAHDAHHLASSGREAATPASGRHAADVHGQPGLVHRSSGPLGAVDPTPGAATADASAPIEGALLGV